MNTPTLIANAEVDKLEKERDAYKKAYENGVTLALEKSVEFEKMRQEIMRLRSQNESLSVMLGQACDEEEGIFRTTGELASVEIAIEYTVWARYLELNFGRTNHCAYDVQDWIDKK